MNVIIIEDEKPAARRLNRMLEKRGIQAETMLHSVADAIQWFGSNEHPDLIFLDIQLSDGLSFEIFEEIPVQSAIIFTTAYDEYALQAFKLNSIDYLLKPIDSDDLNSALEKYKAFKPVSEPEIKLSLHELKKLLITTETKQYKLRFTVKVGQHLKVIPVQEIVCIYSENKGTYVFTNDKRSYLLDHSLEQLEEELDPNQFFRINRKFYVHIKSIVDIVAYTNSRLKLKLNHYTEEELIVSRERVKDFKQWLDE